MVTPAKSNGHHKKDRLWIEVENAFQNAFGKQKVRVYRYNPASLRVRVVDKRFQGQSLVERERESWPIIESLSADARRDLTVVLLLSPEETKESLVNLEFEEPSRSRL